MSRRAWILALALAGCAPRAEESPGLVLVTLDTFRQDHLGAMGNPLVRTPYLDRIARRGVAWPSAFTATPLTTPSHATILSGLSPASHGLLRNRARLAPGVRTIAQQLSNAGFRTGAIVASRVVLDPEFGLDRGFASYTVVEPARLPGSGEGAHVADRALEWLARHGGPKSFLWVHFFDAHLPYLPPPPWGRVYGTTNAAGSPVHGDAAADPRAAAENRARYAGEISFLDRCVGRIARALELRGDRADLLVTADHGEGLGEHDDYFGHDVLLYDTAVRVPLVLASFGPATSRRANALDPGTARTIDIAPTLAGLAGLAADAHAEGRDLLREAAVPDAAELFLETHPDPAKSPPRYALRRATAKAIFHPEDRNYEFFDLAADPGESRDLGTNAGGAYAALAATLAARWQARPADESRTVDEERGGVDDATRRALESLGYVNR